MSLSLILLIAFVAFIIWHFIPQRSDEPTPNPRFRPEARAKAHDPNWRAFFEEHCESPAEVGFLHAMINRFELLPESGSLRGSGLKLDLQVGEGRYRTDFLVNNWLVVEIDGATYHSSPEAITNDQERDRYFESLGYSVVRIPAKVVFNEPAEAVRRFESAFALGKRPPVIVEQKNGFVRLSETVAGAGKFMNDINDHVSRSRAIDAAINGSREAFSSEKIAITAALDQARRRVETNEWIGESPSRKVAFEQATRRMEALFEKHDQTTASRHDEKLVVREFLPPDLSRTPDFRDEIERSYERLALERKEFFQEARQQLRKDKRLEPHVQDILRDLGCDRYWHHIN